MCIDLFYTFLKFWDKYSIEKWRKSYTSLVYPYRNKNYSFTLTLNLSLIIEIGYRKFGQMCIISPQKNISSEQVDKTVVDTSTLISNFLYLARSVALHSYDFLIFNRNLTFFLCCSALDVKHAFPNVLVPGEWR